VGWPPPRRPPPPGPWPGSTSGGDPYFPAAGNGGYQVSHYDLNLRYDPASKALTARAILLGTTSAALRSFSLDLRDLTVSAVTVNGRRARFTHAGGELVVTPSRPLPARAPFVVGVAYGGHDRPARGQHRRALRLGLLRRRRVHRRTSPRARRPGTR
jgi:aminopeptidase N